MCNTLTCVYLWQNKQKELAILCFLKQVDFNPNDLDSSVSALSEKLEMEIALEAAPDAKAFPRTQAVVQGVLQRLYLLLHVTIAPDSGIGRSLSHAPFKVIPNVMVRSDTDVLKPYARSISAPLDPHVVQDDSVLDIKTCVTWFNQSLCNRVLPPGSAMCTGSLYPFFRTWLNRRRRRRRRPKSAFCTSYLPS